MITASLLLALTLSAQLPTVTFDRCHDAAFYAATAAEAREAWTPWVEVLDREVRAADTYDDLLLRIDGLRIGYVERHPPDVASRIAFDRCLRRTPL